MLPTSFQDILGELRGTMTSRLGAEVQLVVVKDEHGYVVTGTAAPIVQKRRGHTIDQAVIAVMLGIDELYQAMVDTEAVRRRGYS